MQQFFRFTCLSLHALGLPQLRMVCLHRILQLAVVGSACVKLWDDPWLLCFYFLAIHQPVASDA